MNIGRFSDSNLDRYGSNEAFSLSLSILLIQNGDKERTEGRGDSRDGRHGCMHGWTREGVEGGEGSGGGGDGGDGGSGYAAKVKVR